MLFNLSSKCALIIVTLLCAGTLRAGDFNRIDDSGQRQGYWIIKGSMVHDPAFKPEAVVEEGTYKDNRKEGIWRKFWPGGNLHSEINYELGRPYGAYKIYYDNGKIEEQGNWVNNKQTGSFKRWYSSGAPQQEFVFNDDGKRNGWQKYYHETGKTALELQVTNGQESGLCNRYNEDGSLQEERTFAKGVLSPPGVVTHKSAPEEVVEAEIHNEEIGKPSEKTEDSPNSAIKFRPNGHNELYDNHGNLTHSGVFKDGRLWDGKQFKYNNDGLMIRIEVYSTGKYIGTGVMAEENK